MRRTLIVVTPVVAGLLAACPSPEQERRALAERRAGDVLALYQSWDEALAAEVFSGDAVRRAHWDETIAWLRPRLGACGEPELVDARCKGSEGRFRYLCEGGALEFEPWIRDGQVHGAKLAGRGIDAPDNVQRAAEAVVAAMPFDAADHARWPAGDDFVGDYARGLGRCRIAAPDIVGKQGALYYLECEGGQAHLKINVDPGDGAPSVLKLTRPASDRFRFGGPRGA
ncbi:MAG: hypothetical protein R3B09_18670 [Nannocystaceae bacterium]